MSTYRLDRLFAPQSIALIGASERAGSLGHALLRNVRQAGFAGRIDLVNPQHKVIEGLPAVPSLADLTHPPDVIVVATPAAAVPELVRQAGDRGVAAAVILTAGLGHGADSPAEACESVVRKTGLRIVGPNCLGVMVPSAKLNMTFASRMASPGNLALISQSGAIAAGLIDWAEQRRVGFSAIVSIGDQLDVDIGDLLDYFALDPHTRAILLYIEGIKDARKFMSAARAASRVKPVVAIKAGRSALAAKAAATHTGALAGSDAVYDAALRRSGILRVFDLGELFDAAETLNLTTALVGPRLAILTNGGGIGVLAVDRLADLGGAPAALSEPLLRQLNTILPPTWSHSNPVDIIGDADPARYEATFNLLLRDPGIDAVLVMNVQTALSPAVAVAERIATAHVAATQQSIARKPVFSVWVGNEPAVANTFDQARIAHFETESDAVRSFMHLVRRGEAAEALMATPPSLPQDFSPEVAKASATLDRVLADDRTWLDPLEVADVLTAYAIPAVPTVLATNPDEAAERAAVFLDAGQAVAVKIHSREIVHKSDVGGVALNLTTRSAVRQAAAYMMLRVRTRQPDARISGVTIQPMIIRPAARELIAGVADNPTFGPVIAFGHGGTAVEVINDKVLALPPLDLNLARDMIARTRVSRLLGAYRNVPAAKVDDVALVLVKLAQLVADCPQLRELDINPLLADETGVLALDTRIAVAPFEAKFKGPGYARMAIRPYPRELERHIEVAPNWRVFVRPVRPQDEPLFGPYFQHVTAEDLRLRFFGPMKEFSHQFIARLTQIDYARAMAFVAIDESSGDLLGVVRLHADANYQTGEYAIMLRSDLKGRGLGWKLMEILLDYARAEKLAVVEGQVLVENRTMLEMCAKLGFEIARDPNDAKIARVRLNLA